MDMVKAHITTKSGAKLTIEGSDQEVAALIARIEGHTQAPKQSLPTRGATTKAKSKPTLAGLIAELIDGGFFKKPKELGSIKVALEEHGHFYPVTTLSPTMLRLVRRKQLRRIKENNRWLYVG